MAKRNKIQESIERMIYDRPTTGKKATSMRKSWKEVNSLLDSFNKKSKKK